jgi:hypothetical protein
MLLAPSDGRRPTLCLTRSRRFRFVCLTLSQSFSAKASAVLVPNEKPRPEGTGAKLAMTVFARLFRQGAR